MAHDTLNPPETASQYPRKVRLGQKSYSLRRMTEADGPLVQQFALRLPKHDLLFMRRDISKQEGVDRWIAALQRGAMHTVLCEDDEGLAGYSSIHLTELDWSRHVGELRVQIAERARGGGLGRYLTREAFNLALALNIEKVAARMTPDQTGARALFQELGFQPEALLKDEVKDANGEYHDLLIMACNVQTFLAQRHAFGVTQ
ncbi:MAG: N-acetyltransferase family protein [Gammaproteobacteria bacterium]